jgi:hypothetical protein
VVRFTSEQDARRFEPVAPVEADEPAQEERRRLITDLRCFDLRDPQLLSPSSLGALDSVDVEQAWGWRCSRRWARSCPCWRWKGPG